MKKFTGTIEDIGSVENLLGAWREFLPGKRIKRDVAEFSLCLMDNIFALHEELVQSTYQHGGYYAFNISDPKPRNIHKASVRDRLVHHAIYRRLYPFFDRIFIADSFSCRIGKGTHRALDRFRSFVYRAGKNNTRTVWVLKCDIKKFFANINQEILLKILCRYFSDPALKDLLAEIVDSFSTVPGKGLPLGNLTSQLLVNVYMNEFDQFVKHKLKAEYYIRYADDFAVLSYDRAWLQGILLGMEKFLNERLKLETHPDKVFIKTLASGVDFLGWVHFPDHRVLRTATKRRMLKRISENYKLETISSYRGLLQHGNTWKLSQNLDTWYLAPDARLRN